MPTQFSSRLVRCLAFACTLAIGIADARGEVKLISFVSLPGNATDLSGLTEVLSGGTPHNRLGGHGSAIAYTGSGNRYVMVPDRGPGDGSAEYKLRYHIMEIPVALDSVKITLVSTTLLRTEDGKNFVGSSGTFDAADPAKSLRLDPEGVRVSRDGNLFISDEYGPYIYEFGVDGKRIRSLQVPEKFKILKPSASAKAELPPNNKSGRQPNKGMEGLAITPDGRRLVGIMQSPLMQDGAFDQAGKRIGLNNRILEVDLDSGKTCEYVYTLERPKTGVCEILAVNDHEFLVLERDGDAGDKAQDKKIFHIDIAGATDVSNVGALPTKDLPDTIKPVKKKLFIDLLDPKFKLSGPQLPQKIEGLTFGPDLPDGRRLLLVSSDNDFIEKDPSFIYAFAIDAADLPGYKAQEFGKNGLSAPK